MSSSKRPIPRAFLCSFVTGYLMATKFQTNPRVFVHGNCLADLTESSILSPPIMERICARLTQHTGGAVLFDWHPVAGHPALLYLGDHATAVAAYHAQREYLQAEANRYNEATFGSSRPSALGLPPEEGGPEIFGPNAITWGQAIHAERVARENQLGQVVN